jgi:hypothetical protein
MFQHVVPIETGTRDGRSVDETSMLLVMLLGFVTRGTLFEASSASDDHHLSLICPKKSPKMGGVGEFPPQLCKKEVVKILGHFACL